MDGVVNLAAALLSLAHRIFGPGVCPGDWVWATATAGSLIALLPLFASVFVAVVRKGTGNRYHSATLMLFGTVGVLFAFLLPWLLSIGSSEVFRAAWRRDTSVGLQGDDLVTLNNEYCFGVQRDYLGGGPTVYDVLFYPFEGALKHLLHIGTLVLVPGLCLLFVWLQTRAALRRGPKWPGRLIWIPFLVLILLSAPLAAQVAIYLWLGFLPVAVLGMIPVLIVGAPSWATIERSNQQAPRRVMPPPPTFRPPPPVPRTPPPPPMRPALREPEPDRAALARLAAEPGPLPFTPRGAVPAAATSSVWTRSGRFRKVRPLGHGGFGTVWLAVDTQLDRTVAVKIAHAPDGETEERMLREARALAAVHHPNCVRVYDIVADTDGLGLIMEYIEGLQLAEAVHEGGTLDDVAAARLWMTMAGALSAAHSKGVLHRDVKPANVIIDPDGTAHLIDFGIARSRGDATLTATGMMVGTPDFLAPETAAGAVATPASDAWQLAATVSFALSGHPPRGVRENAMAALLAASRAERLSHLPHNSAHQQLLVASLDADPARRPTLNAVAREMRNWLSRAGHAEDGPVTSVVDAETIARAERTRPLR
ncbi:MAG TPA: serine/threonine-protein kinase [Actinophytocola sp.]|uniref:serine/threonine-protein kinase n=1 Tax=Actinophytocola sp. TaxID=1872138 RepID=UPI002DBE1A5D|nr:serine/threonine-protein kinase [Actinophytocola sp.]HEU5475757.1 serine/threonine-protein kinase [Actinophytocola sp.]